MLHVSCHVTRYRDKRKVLPGRELGIHYLWTVSSQLLLTFWKQTTVANKSKLNPTFILYIYQAASNDNISQTLQSFSSMKVCPDNTEIVISHSQYIYDSNITGSWNIYWSMHLLIYQVHTIVDYTCSKNQYPVRDTHKLQPGTTELGACVHRTWGTGSCFYPTTLFIK